MSVQIRQAITTDFNIIDPTDPFGGNRATEITRGEIWIIENEATKTYLGYLTLSYRFFECPFIAYVFIEEQYRRKGLATQLFAFAEKLCQGQRIYTSTETNNNRMLSLLNRRGYEISGMISSLPQKHPEIIFHKDV